VVKDYDHFVDLLSRPMPAYLQDRTPYNPFKFTLECSRSGSSPLAGWATLKLFGREGFQVMLGRLVEVGISLRKLLEQEKNFVCVNADNHGFVTLFRVYPRHVDAKKQYELELGDAAHRDELRAYNQLQTRVANKIFAMLRDPAQRTPGWENPPYTSFTSGFRATSYRLPDSAHPDENDEIAALKAYPMSPNSNELSMLLLRNYVAMARDLAVAELLAEESGAEAGEAQKAYDWFGERKTVARKYLVPPAERSRAEALRQVPLCANFDDAQCDHLLGDAVTLKKQAGELLFAEGDKADKVYVILSGKAKIFKRDPSGGELEISTVAQGSFFGEMALFDRGTRSASVKCIESCEFLAIDGDRFLREALG
jgi:hypothetical protein